MPPHPASEKLPIQGWLKRFPSWLFILVALIGMVVAAALRARRRMKMTCLLGQGNGVEMLSI